MGGRRLKKVAYYFTLVGMTIWTGLWGVIIVAKAPLVEYPLTNGDAVYLSAHIACSFTYPLMVWFAGFLIGAFIAIVLK